jgi:hypothetical protein
MRCVYCNERAGLLRKICPVCTRVIWLIDTAAGQVGWTELVDLFAAEGLNRDQVDRVLDAEVGSEPTLRDQLTSRMANVLMRNLGMPGRQSPEDVRRVRHGMASGGGAGTSVAAEKPSGTT